MVTTLGAIVIVLSTWVFKTHKNQPAYAVPLAIVSLIAASLALPISWYSNQPTSVEKTQPVQDASRSAKSVRLSSPDQLSTQSGDEREVNTQFRPATSYH